MFRDFLPSGYFPREKKQNCHAQTKHIFIWERQLEQWGLRIYRLANLRKKISEQLTAIRSFVKHTLLKLPFKVAYLSKAQQKRGEKRLKLNLV